MARARSRVGGLMLRMTGLVLAGVFITFASHSPRTPVTISLASSASIGSLMAQVPGPNAGPTTVQDIGAVLGAARGVSPIMCAFAARAVWGGGWGMWYD